MMILSNPRGQQRKLREQGRNMERNQVKLISDGFCLQQLRVGLVLPDRNWGQVAVVKTLDPSC